MRIDLRLLAGIFLVSVVGTALVTFLLVSVFQRQSEAQLSYFKVVEENCVEYHRDTLDRTFLLLEKEKRCATCHPEVGHAF